MIVHIVRLLYLMVVLAYTISFAFSRYKVYKYDSGGIFIMWYIIVPAVLASLLVMLDMFWRKKRLHSLSGLFFGLGAGLVIAYAVTQIVDMVGTVFVMEPVAQTDRQPQPSERGKPRSITIVQPSSHPAEEIPVDGDTAETSGSPKCTDDLSSEAAETAQSLPQDPILELIKVLLGVSSVFLCVSFVLQTKDDFRFVIPYVEFSRETRGARPLLLDTSAIIDGRIADIADTRILESTLIVPRFVLAELQMIADSADKLKRNRGRRGLDILNRLQTHEAINIEIRDVRPGGAEDNEDVDSLLVGLGKDLNGRIVTNDYNLNKIAQLRGVDVININDLANALKPVVLPGEKLNIKMIKPGEESGQGVGYLEDGTMVVAEHGRNHVGEEIQITITSVLQTSAGRMIFGRFEHDEKSDANGAVKHG